MENNNFLVSYSKNGVLSYHSLIIDVDAVNCIPIYEDLIFVALFIDGKRLLQPTNEREVCFFNSFTQQERYLIASEFFDSKLIRDSEFRKQNTPFCPRLNIFPILHLTPVVNGVYKVTSNVYPIGLQISMDGVIWNNFIQHEILVGGDKSLYFGSSLFLRLTTLDFLHHSEICHYEYIDEPIK